MVNIKYLCVCHLHVCVRIGDLIVQTYNVRGFHIKSVFRKPSAIFHSSDVISVSYISCSCMLLDIPRLMNNWETFYINNRLPYMIELFPQSELKPNLQCTYFLRYHAKILKEWQVEYMEVWQLKKSIFMWVFWVTGHFWGNLAVLFFFLVLYKYCFFSQGVLVVGH